MVSENTHIINWKSFCSSRQHKSNERKEKKSRGSSVASCKIFSAIYTELHWWAFLVLMRGCQTDSTKIWWFCWKGTIWEGAAKIPFSRHQWVVVKGRPGTLSPSSPFSQWHGWQHWDPEVAKAVASQGLPRLWHRKAVCLQGKESYLDSCNT